MTDLRAPRRGFPRAVVRAVPVLLAGMIAALALGPAAAASASLGSVTAQVAAYVADGGMLARLSDVYGKNAAGAGIDFDATTKAGPISRVYEWTAARHSNPTTDHPVQLSNNWVVPITIADKPVGLATLWINPQTVAPELADFAASPALATAMAAVPATSALVRDATSHAWFALADGIVTPLVAGTSGVSKPTPVDAVKLSDAAAPVIAPTGSNAGLGLAIGAVGVVVVVIVVALLVPRRRRPKAAVVTVPDAAARVEPEPALVEPAIEPVAIEPVAVEAAAQPAPKPRARPAAAKTGTPVTKPVGSKPGSRAPSSAAASTKPRIQKPPVQKPPMQKPPVQKSPGPKPPMQKPPVQKPPGPKPPGPKPPTRKPPTPPTSPEES